MRNIGVICRYIIEIDMTTIDDEIKSIFKYGRQIVMALSALKMATMYFYEGKDLSSYLYRSMHYGNKKMYSKSDLLTIRQLGMAGKSNGEAPFTSQIDKEYIDLVIKEKYYLNLLSALKYAVYRLSVGGAYAFKFNFHGIVKSYSAKTLVNLYNSVVASGGGVGLYLYSKPLELSLVGSSPVNVYRGLSYTEQSVTANKGDVSITTTSDVDTDVSGTYTVTYVGEGLDGLDDEISRSVVVLPNWVQKGSDIQGSATYERSGSSVSLSNDGLRIAVGAPIGGENSKGVTRVYEWNTSGGGSGSWEQLGSDIVGESDYDYSGEAVSISGDGGRVAIGAVLNGTYRGHIRVYEWNTSGGGGDESWVQLGTEIVGEANYDRFGTSVALNTDGSRLVGGGRYNEGNGSLSGHVRVYKWNAGSEGGSESWEQMGSDIDAEAIYDRAGHAVAIDGDGERVAVGASYNDGAAGDSSGHVRVYEWNAIGGSWDQMGSDIDGEAAYDRFGGSVGLSTDGSRVIGGARYNSGGSAGTYSGHAKVYEWDDSSSSWVQLGNDIDGENQYDHSGSSVAISGNGEKVAIGAPYNSDSSTYAGHVRVYEWDDSGESWTLLGLDIDGEDQYEQSGAANIVSVSSSDTSGDKTGTCVSLSSDGTVVGIGASLNNDAGSLSGETRVFQYA